jgi:hypothetical protein
MKKKIIIGLVIGLIAGIIDLIPMLIQKLTWDANLSAFSMWIVIGFLLAITNLKMKGIFNGLAIALLVLVPNLFIIGWKEPLSIIPILIMTVILGSCCGYFYQRLIRE